MPVDPTEDLPREAIRSVLRDHPVRLAILFGSRATGRTHEGSDVDIAVELDGLEPGSAGFNEAFFTLSADLSATLGTDDWTSSTSTCSLRGSRRPSSRTAYSSSALPSA